MKTIFEFVFMLFGLESEQSKAYAVVLTMFLMFIGVVILATPLIKIIGKKLEKEKCFG